MKTKLPLSIFIITILTLTAVGCNNNKRNSISRPQPVMEKAQENTSTESGEVAGTETIQLPVKNIKVNDLNLEVEVADNDAARGQGLSGREQLEDGKGMLFDFNNTDFHKPGFWMKDMLMSIDIIWIDNGKIIAIEKNAPIPSEDEDIPVYYPPTEITHVLEVPAGWTDKNNVTIGSTITL